ncbi:hypothetical protein C8T65DRAFT_740398 [Cerioporus squamosus]|nr:hypothetical protein C8T65DRAFT_740398 [Cerioporus squamosus]
MRDQVTTDSEYLSRTFVMRHDLERADGSAHEETITSLFHLAVASAQHACLLALDRKSGRGLQYNAVQDELREECAMLEASLQKAIGTTGGKLAEVSESPYDDTYVNLYAPTQPLHDLPSRSLPSSDTLLADLLALLKEPMTTALVPSLLLTLEDAILTTLKKGLEQKISDTVTDQLLKALPQLQAHLEESVKPGLSVSLQKTLEVSLVTPESAAVQQPLAQALVPQLVDALVEPITARVVLDARVSAPDSTITQASAIQAETVTVSVPAASGSRPRLVRRARNGRSRALLAPKVEEDEDGVPLKRPGILPQAWAKGPAA